MHTALGLRHLSRIDLIIDEDGTPWFLEANVLPGLTETSLLPLALEAANHDLGWVYTALAEAAVQRHPTPPPLIGCLDPPVSRPCRERVGGLDKRRLARPTGFAGRSRPSDVSRETLRRFDVPALT